MGSWTPATREDVLRAIDEEADEAGPKVWADIAPLLIEPYVSSFERDGHFEQAFVVARLRSRIVFYEDVEEMFGTATEVDGRLIDCAIYAGGSLQFSLIEAARGY